MPRHIELVKHKAFEVQGIQAELEGAEWNAIKLRSQHPESPHREVDDIWVRYNPLENYHGDMAAFNGEHEAKWYPVAERLPSVKRVSEELMDRLGGVQLGFVLLTRIAPGKQVYAHIDQGWHARHYEKFCICVKADKKQSFNFKDEELRTEDGDLFYFDNAYPHWVINDSDRERISLIVCIRRANMKGAT
jgi:uncharacterized RmlC-like cupin family protein